MSLEKKTISGIFWNSLSTVLLKLLNFAITIVLARLLAPSDFGVVSVALVVVNFFEIFRDLGIGSAIIYKKEDITIARDTAFFMFPAIAVIFYIISYLIAPISADFFKMDELTVIIRTLSLTFIIWSFGSLPRTLLSKDLEFKKLLVPQILPRISYGVVAIVMAFQGFGVWSLILGRLVYEISSLIAVWSVSNWKPSINFNKKIALELLNYGKHVMVSEIILFFISVIDVTVIGRTLGPEKLGFYSVAISASGFFTTQISLMLSQVMFPAYSKIQEDLNRMAMAFQETLKYLSFVVFPAAVGIMSLSWYFIKVIYGDKWLPAATVLKILCLYGLSTSLLYITQNLFLASGNPKIVTKINFLQLIFMAIIIYPLTVKYGILGTSIAVIIPSIIVLLLTFNEASKIINQSLITVLKTMLPATTGSLIMFIFVTISQKLLIHFSPLTILLISILLGAFVYLIYLWRFHYEQFSYFTKLFSKNMPT